MSNIDRVVRQKTRAAEKAQGCQERDYQRQIGRDVQKKDLQRKDEKRFAYLNYANSIVREQQRIFALVGADVELWKEYAIIGPKRTLGLRHGLALLPIGIARTNDEYGAPVNTFGLYIRSDGELRMKVRLGASFGSNYDTYYDLRDALERSWGDPSDQLEEILRQLQGYQHP